MNLRKTSITWSFFPQRAVCCLHLLCVALTAISWQANAAGIVCHITYGGETRAVAAMPIASPYDVKAVQVGSYFLFRAVVQSAPPDIAAIKLYVYGDTDDGPVLIHQVDYPYPPTTPANSQYGFTGLHRVYEKIRDGELEYWCASTDKRKAMQ